MSQDDLGDLRRRLRATEQDAAAARVLAGAADRDVSEIRAEIGDFRDDVGRGFVEMRGKLDATGAGQQRIVELIESLIDQQDR